jgi:hypothetical protein
MPSSMWGRASALLIAISGQGFTPLQTGARKQA